MRVLDLSLLFPGPYCGTILAGLGAEVIKIERPGGGDWVRYVPPVDPESGEGLAFRTLNRGKKSLTLNLKAEEGRSILLRLAESADVLLESFRPGVMERLGLGYETLARANERLVYCSLTGYGSTGPYRERAGHDLNYIGLAGLLDLTGPRDGPPSIPGAPLADLTGALWAAIGILGALLAREQTGRGRRVEASLLGGSLACLPLPVASLLGNEPVARGAGELTGGRVCYNLYQAADGGYMSLSALEPEFWLAFCRAVERPDLADQAMAPAVAGEAAYDGLCALFRSRTRREWAEALAGVDACCEPVLDLGEALASEPVRALGMLADGVLLAPIRLTPEVPGAGSLAAPALGHHTAALLAELGYDEGNMARLRAAGVV
jgi:crotonobetainyl-CoA:carnitine CoA-transferase CaiB-like acyl-CoA transferase